MQITNNYVRSFFVGVLVAAIPVIALFVISTAWNIVVIFGGSGSLIEWGALQSELFISSIVFFSALGFGTWASLSLIEWK